MKIIALIATSLALLSAGAIAQEKPTAQRQVKVTVGSVVTLYPWPTKDLNYTATSHKVVADDTKREYRLEGDVMIRLGSGLKIYADKAMIKMGHSDYPSISLQSDGRIESQDGGHKVTQFTSDGTQIEFVPSQ